LSTRATAPAKTQLLFLEIFSFLKKVLPRQALATAPPGAIDPGSGSVFLRREETRGRKK
jgi:hypothetical protein